MGDRSPKDKLKKKKQHDQEVQDLNRARQEKQQRNSHQASGDAKDTNKKAS